MIRVDKGFTLIEVLIAIVITALVGLGSWGALNIAISTNEVTTSSTEELKKLQRAMLVLARDFRQIAARPIRNEFGDLEPALKLDGDFYLIEFTKRGWRNPMEDPRSELQRVAYELVDGELKRYTWFHLDREQDAEPVSRTLLTNIEKLELKYSSNKKWVSTWPPESVDSEDDETEVNKNSKIPDGISFNLVHEKYGEIPRIFEVGTFMENVAFSEKDLSKSEDGDDPSGGGGNGSGAGGGAGGGDGEEDEGNL